MNLIPINVQVFCYYDGENVDMKGTFLLDNKKVHIDACANSSSRGSGTYLNYELVEDDMLEAALTDLMADIVEKVGKDNFSVEFKDGQLV